MRAMARRSGSFFGRAPVGRNPPPFPDVCPMMRAGRWVRHESSPRGIFRLYTPLGPLLPRGLPGAVDESGKKGRSQPGASGRPRGYRRHAGEDDAAGSGEVSAIASPCLCWSEDLLASRRRTGSTRPGSDGDVSPVAGMSRKSERSSYLVSAIRIDCKHARSEPMDPPFPGPIHVPEAVSPVASNSRDLFPAARAARDSAGRARPGAAATAPWLPGREEAQGSAAVQRDGGTAALTRAARARPPGAGLREQPGAAGRPRDLIGRRFQPAAGSSRARRAAKTRSTDGQRGQERPIDLAAPSPAPTTRPIARGRRARGGTAADEERQSYGRGRIWRKDGRLRARDQDYAQAEGVLSQLCR